MSKARPIHESVDKRAFKKKINKKKNKNIADIADILQNRFLFKQQLIIKSFK